MQAIQVGNLKAKFSKILHSVETENEEYLIEYGKSHKKIAVIIPYEKYKRQHGGIKLGYLRGKASIKIQADFKMDDEEFLNQ